jgi:hypothetical protein
MGDFRLFYQNNYKSDGLIIAGIRLVNIRIFAR